MCDTGLHGFHKVFMFDVWDPDVLVFMILSMN